MVVAIVGSRTFAICKCKATRPPQSYDHDSGCPWPADFRLVSRTVVAQKNRAQIAGIELRIISGGAAGADTAAHEAADMWGVPFVEYPVSKEEWKANPKTAGFIRNGKMIHDADMLVAFYAPGRRTKGTLDAVGRAVAARIPTYVHHEGKWTTFHVDRTAPVRP